MLRLQERNQRNSKYIPGKALLMSQTLQVLSADEIRRRIAAVNWFHTIDFGQGIVSPGDDDSQRKLKRLQIPANLTGKSFLDIGAWDGFFSFEAERRGATRVL